MKIFDVIDQLEAPQGFITKETLKYSYMSVSVTKLPSKSKSNLES